MSTKQEMSFASAMEALTDGEEPPIHLIYRLSDISEEDFTYFRRIWPTVHEERRKVLARHMADIAEDDYLVNFTPIFTYLLADESAEVRQAALDGVWDCEDLSLIAPILKMMQDDPVVKVRVAAARALAHFVLMAEWGLIDLSQTDTVVEALLTVYEMPSTPLELRRAALEAMSPSPNARIAELINDAYEEGSDDLQLSALFAMGNSADDRWLPILIDELGSPSPDFRAEAARALGMIGHSDALDALGELVDDPEKEVGLAAIIALSQIGGDQVLEIFNRIANDPEYDEFRDTIAEALEELEWVEGEFELFDLSDDDDDFDLIDDDDLLLN